MVIQGMCNVTLAPPRGEVESTESSNAASTPASKTATVAVKAAMPLRSSSINSVKMSPAAVGSSAVKKENKKATRPAAAKDTAAARSSAAADTARHQRLRGGDTCGGDTLLQTPNLLGIACCAHVCLRWHAEVLALRALAPRHPPTNSRQATCGQGEQHAGDGASSCAAEVLLIGRHVFDDVLAPALRQQVVVVVY